MESVLWFSEQLTVNLSQVALWGGGPRWPRLDERLTTGQHVSGGSTPPSIVRTGQDRTLLVLCFRWGPVLWVVPQGGWQCGGEAGGMGLCCGCLFCLGCAREALGLYNPRSATLWAAPVSGMDTVKRWWMQWRGDDRQTQWQSEGVVAAQQLQPGGTKGVGTFTVLVILLSGSPAACLPSFLIRDDTWLL